MNGYWKYSFVDVKCKYCIRHAAWVTWVPGFLPNQLKPSSVQRLFPAEPALWHVPLLCGWTQFRAKHPAVIWLQFYFSLPLRGQNNCAGRTEVWKWAAAAGKITTGLPRVETWGEQRGRRGQWGKTNDLRKPASGGGTRSQQDTHGQVRGRVHTERDLLGKKTGVNYRRGRQDDPAGLRTEVRTNLLLHISTAAWSITGGTSTTGRISWSNMIPHSNV